MEWRPQNQLAAVDGLKDNFFHMDWDDDSSEFWLIHAEAATAAGLLGNGIAAVKQATLTSRSKVNEGFFSFTIGLERLTKLILILFHHEDSGRYPSKAELKTYGHDLVVLYEKVLKEAKRRKIQGVDFEILTKSPFLNALKILSRFAKSARYYNLDTLAGGAKDGLSPLEEWDRQIFRFIRKNHLRRNSKEFQATRRLANSSMAKSVFVLSRDYSGRPVERLDAMLLHTAEAKTLQKFSGFFMAALVRECARVLNEAGKVGNTVHELFILFDQDDAFLKRRKTWNLYR